MNIGKQNYSSFNQCDYATSGENKVINHLQNHCDGLKKNNKDKTDNGIQIEKEVSFLKSEESSRKTANRRVRKDSDIEGSKVLRNVPNPKAAGTEFIWTVPRELNEDNQPISLESQEYDASVNDNRKQEDDENVGTSETEEVQNNTIDVNNMVAIAIQ